MVLSSLVSRLVDQSSSCAALASPPISRPPAAIDVKNSTASSVLNLSLLFLSMDAKKSLGASPLACASQHATKLDHAMPRGTDGWESTAHLCLLCRLFEHHSHLPDRAP